MNSGSLYPYYPPKTFSGRWFRGWQSGDSNGAIAWWHR